MLAARIHGHGGNEVLRLDEIPTPERKPGEALIRMVAGGLNRVDLYMRNSGVGITHRLPIILGLDGAGVIEEADEDAPFRAGDPVVVYPGSCADLASSAARAKRSCAPGAASSASRSTGPWPNSSARRSAA
jgi:NADPH:quinone reductase-like Zn-dependent oxidoreductase